jgi:pimeloyl-ACP methyl ester carboxylesterase
VEEDCPDPLSGEPRKRGHFLPSAIASRLPSALYRDRLSGAQTAALVDGLAALIDTLEIDRANLLGSSLAGHWLQTFGSRHHRRIKSLILASTFRGSYDLRNHPQFSIPTLQAVDGEVLKAETL